MYILYQASPLVNPLKTIKYSYAVMKGLTTVGFSVTHGQWFWIFLDKITIMSQT